MARWEDICADKRARIAASIPEAWRIDTTNLGSNVMGVAVESGLLSAAELEITGSSATDLVAELAAGRLKAVDVTLAFCKRAAVATQVVNCALEFFPELALAQAKGLDEYYAKYGRPVGPLHGLPISLKDQLRVKGLETSMGYVAWLGQYDERDSVLTGILRRAGAVFYVKTSVPQSLMACETINNIIGRTVNPRNSNWSCGGSSGGEGANVALRGGIIGVGTDIGGSIRVPAAYNFLYGLRPSHGRLPYCGMTNSLEGQEAVHSVVGPIAHSIDDLRLFTKSVLLGQPWELDSKVIPMPWNQAEEDAVKSKIAAKKLTIGYFHCDGRVMPHPPVQRGVHEVISALKEAGHNVVPWAPYQHTELVDLLGKLFTVDGGQDIADALALSGEPAISHVAELVAPDQPRASMTELWALQTQKWHGQTAYLAALRAREDELGAPLDAIVAPIMPSAAVLHDQSRYYGYASVVNFLDFTSVVVPVTLADRTLDRSMQGYVPLNELDAEVQAGYDPDAYHGAPVGVQVIGRRLTEEKTLAIAEEIGRLLGNQTAP